MKPNTENRHKIPGMALILQLLKKSQDLEMDKYQLSEKIGITYPYLVSLINGNRPVSGISTPKLRVMADFLEISLVQALMLAEIVVPSDFVACQNQDLEKQLDVAIESMRNDPDWSMTAPTKEEWENLSSNSKLGIAMLWENFTHKRFVEKAKMIIVEREKFESNEEGNISSYAA